MLVVEGAGRTSVSRPIEFVEKFEATIKDGKGNPAAHARLRLHADRGPSVDAKTDADGKCSALVPPGNYHVEILGPLDPGDRIVLADRSAAEDPDAPPVASPSAAAPPEAAPSEDAPSTSTSTESPASTAVLNIRLVKRDGSPMPGARYEIHQADGTVVSGTLDAQGTAKVTVDDPSGCHVSYPDIHGSEWGHA
jgi:hypothetical protein